ncbi:hypothetical protein NPIL_552151 [Nephila pilipes]|uniref:Secreted protein n=1 Tax=Nephila pilipes TaxID=299642 RepID=A0A8X6MVI2_NEPPI|nr:hypothetical protein NPIL_552151 [Nephila pilipes]
MGGGRWRILSVMTALCVAISDRKRRQYVMISNTGISNKKVNPYSRLPILRLTAYHHPQRTELLKAFPSVILKVLLSSSQIKWTEPTLLWLAEGRGNHAATLTYFAPFPGT